MSATAEKSAVGTWQFDKVHSSAQFAVKHTVANFRGSFAEVDAELEYVDGRPVLTGTVQVASLDVAEPALKGHLQSPEFFDAEAYPEIKFVTSSATVNEDGTLAIEGDLTLRGHTEHVATSGQINYVDGDVIGNERYGIELETVVDRTAYGLNWQAPTTSGGQVLGNDVSLTVHLEFYKSE